jgi:predicted PurR-regulated permease PerM
MKKVSLKKIPVDWKKFMKRVAVTPISTVLLVIWIVFSVLYVGYDLWQEIKQLPVEQAYTSGRTEALNSIVTNASTCKPINVQSNAGTAQLINVACLQQKDEAPAG